MVLLADGRTGNLDPATSAAVFDSLSALAWDQGVACLVATHNVELAGRMAHLRQHPTDLKG